MLVGSPETALVYGDSPPQASEDGQPAALRNIYWRVANHLHE
ncbi:hypothetical protein [Haloprofundus salilacus]|nr:hypothetical protein [Haloprofundus salilacus]